MIAQRTKHLLVITLMTCAVGLFFARLWYPEPHVYINPEYGASDITHFNVPVRQAYWEAIQSGNMPLWNKHMGGGFPLYAESQAGSWYVPNIVLYCFLPFVDAFNASYVLAWLLGMWGMYAWTYYRYRRIDVACVSGWVFVFSGYFVGHIQHLNMLQTASLVPWIGLSVALARRQAPLWWLGALLLTSQQIFAGHLQTSFLTGCLLLMMEGVAYVSRQQTLKSSVLRVMSIASMFVGAFAILAAIQVYPSWELHNLSVRSEAFSLKEVMHFSLHPSMLTTFIAPFSQGSIADGSFTFLKKLADTGAIFWESWLYMGWICALLCMVSVLFVTKSREVMGLWGGLLISAGLMTARYSPLYFVYSIPPFQFFTTPARWSLVFMVFVILLIGYVLPKLPRIAVLCIGVVLLIDVVKVWYPYGVIVPVADIMKAPSTVQMIQQDTTLPSAEKKIMTLPDRRWQTEFVQHGWKNPQYYTQLYGGVRPNMNLLWDMTSQHEYVGRIWTRRKNTWDSLVAGVFVSDPRDPRRIVGERATSLSSIDYLVSQHPVELSGFETLKSQDNPSFTVSRTLQSSPRVYLTQKVETVQSVEDIIEKMASPLYSGEVFSEQDLGIKSTSSQPKFSTKILTDEHTRLTLSIEASEKALLVVTDTYYPGWSAYVNGVESPIYPINISQRGIVVSEGSHTVEFQYNPISFRRGAWVSSVGHIIVLVVVFLVLARGCFFSLATSSPPSRS